jgi:hypothetical protein
MNEQIGLGLSFKPNEVVKNTKSGFELNISETVKSHQAGKQMVMDPLSEKDKNPLKVVRSSSISTEVIESSWKDTAKNDHHGLVHTQNFQLENGADKLNAGLTSDCSNTNEFNDNWPEISKLEIQTSDISLDRNFPEGSFQMTQSVQMELIEHSEDFGLKYQFQPAESTQNSAEQKSIYLMNSPDIKSYQAGYNEFGLKNDLGSSTHQQLYVPTVQNPLEFNSKKNKTDEGPAPSKFCLECDIIFTINNNFCANCGLRLKAYFPIESDPLKRYSCPTIGRFGVNGSFLVSVPGFVTVDNHGRKSYSGALKSIRVSDILFQSIKYECNISAEGPIQTEVNSPSLLPIIDELHKHIDDESTTSILEYFSHIIVNFNQ